MAKFNLSENWELIKLLRIDVYFFFAVFAIYMPAITINQLIQDKYCINTYGIDESICLELEKADENHTELLNQVLEDATTLKMYSTIINVLPGIFFSLFLGYWVDTYPSHIQYLLAVVPISAITQMLMVIYQCVNFDTEPLTLLYTYIPPSIFGSIAIVMTGSYTYITRKTPAKYRAVRFAILELFLFCAIPLASSVGGAVLTMEPWFAGQHRNYIGVFIIGIAACTISSLWVAILLNDTGHDDDEIAKRNEINDEAEVNNNGDTIDVDKRPCRNGKEGKIPILLDIINIRNVANTLHTSCKRRKHYGRITLFTTMIGMTICMVGYMGETAIGFQFVQRVYHWDAAYYSYISSTTIMIPAIITLIAPPILIHKFHFHDSAVGVIGSTSLVLGMFARGFILKPAGFFVGILFAGCSGLLPMSYRAIIARVIKHNEIGQVYSLLSCVESLGPLISSLFFSEIFKATLSTSPGLVYISAGFVILIPMVTLVILYLTRHTWDLVLRGEMAAPNPEGQTQACDPAQAGQDDINTQVTPVIASRVIYHNTEQSATDDECNELEQIETISVSEEVTVGKVEIIIEQSGDIEDKPSD